MKTTHPHSIFRHRIQTIEPFKYNISKHCFAAQVCVTACVCMCVGRCTCTHLNIFVCIYITCIDGFHVRKDICVQPLCVSVPLLVFCHCVGFCQGLCVSLCVCVPQPAAGPEAPAPAELCVSGYPGTLQASHTSERTTSGSPSSKQQSPSPSTETHTHTQQFDF